MKVNYEEYKLVGYNNQIKLAGCWVHARRKYYEAKDADASRANHSLDIFTQVYKYEAICREYETHQRKEYRQEHILPLIHNLYTNG